MASDVPVASSASAGTSSKGAKAKKPATAEVLLARRKKLWHSIVKKDISKAAKARLTARKELLSNAKKVCIFIIDVFIRPANTLFMLMNIFGVGG